MIVITRTAVFVIRVRRELHVSRIPETSKCQTYFLRFFSRVLSSFIDTVGSFLLS